MSDEKAKKLAEEIDAIYRWQGRTAQVLPLLERAREEWVRGHRCEFCGRPDSIDRLWSQEEKRDA